MIVDLAAELLSQVFLSCPSISDAVNLACTCKRLHSVFKSHKLPILAQAAEQQYGPLQDAIQLVTHNTSQQVHIIRTVPLSVSLIQQVVQVGIIANRWAAIYPTKKWRENFENRRVLTEAEQYVFRRAIYRIWLFSVAFHNAAHTRYTRASPPMTHERSLLLHNSSTSELAEMYDVHRMLRDVVERTICPSNGTIRRKFNKRFPDANHQLIFNFNMHLNYPLPRYSGGRGNVLEDKSAIDRYGFAKYTPTRIHEPGSEGWGDDITHYYVVEDMMKLDPKQLLWLKENAVWKSQVQAFVREVGMDWFENNGETFGQTLSFVLGQRGVDPDEFREAVEESELGVAVDQMS